MDDIYDDFCRDFGDITGEINDSTMIICVCPLCCDMHYLFSFYACDPAKVHIVANLLGLLIEQQKIINICHKMLERFVFNASIKTFIKRQMVHFC